MRVRCERDGKAFEAHPAPYPGEGRQTTEYATDGDRYIECPTCARRYFFHTSTGKWSSDRDLEIVGEGPTIRYWSIWNAHVPMAKCIAPDKESAIANFRHHGYGGGDVDENTRTNHERLQTRTLPSVGERDS